MTTPELNQSLLAALKALVEEVDANACQIFDEMVSVNWNKHVCLATTFNNAKAAIEAAERQDTP